MTKRTYFIFILFLMQHVFLSAQNLPDTIRIISYNIWYDNPNNAGNTWADRREDLKSSLLDIRPAIVCVQEALAQQVADLEVLGFASFGAGRDDGKHGGEHTAIFFKPERFRIGDGGNFWLSPWPDSTGSVGWDAMLPRIATWVRLEDIQSDGSFYVFNTHFSHVGDTARLESARLLMREVKRIAGALPVVLTGDLNCLKGSPPYDVIIHLMKDSRYLSPQPNPGPDYSFAGSSFQGEAGNIIDHIFLTGNVEVLSSQVIDNCTDGRCPSDHLPVVADIRLK